MQFRIKYTILIKNSSFYAVQVFITDAVLEAVHTHTRSTYAPGSAIKYTRANIGIKKTKKTNPSKKVSVDRFNS